MTSLEQKLRAAQFVQLTHRDGTAEVITFAEYLGRLVKSQVDPRSHVRALWPREVA